MGRGGTAAWGPPVWQTIHFVALAYRGENRDAYVAFYEALRGALPCSACAQHYSKELDEDPVQDNLGSNGELFNWTVRIHNSVNERLGKRKWDTDEAWNHYSQLVFSPPPPPGSSGKKEAKADKTRTRSKTNDITSSSHHSKRDNKTGELSVGDNDFSSSGHKSDIQTDNVPSGARKVYYMILAFIVVLLIAVLISMMMVYGKRFGKRPGTKG